MKKHQIYIFIGPPGSGKGSISKLCMEHLKWQQLSTGNLCRQQIADQTDIGKEIDVAIKEGKLVADSVIVEMVNEWILKNIDTVSALILDGYPRTLVQAQEFKKLIKEKLHSCDVKIIKLKLSDEEILARLLNRATCKNKMCQMTFSLRPNSGLMPKFNMSCDSCGDQLNRRSDDESVAIKERIKTYYKHEDSLLDFYKDVGIDIQTIHAEQPLKEVFSELKSELGLGTL